MQQAMKGDTVSVHYHGKLTDGSTFDSSEGRDPLQFTLGSGQVIKGFDDAVSGMAVGEKKTVHIPVAEAYGERSAEMMMEFPLSEFPADLNPMPGLELHMSDDQGNVFPVTVAEVRENSVVLDANHPLSGEDLIFELELVRIG
jgi:peptidylprolyl isomerase